MHARSWWPLAQPCCSCRPLRSSATGAAHSSAPSPVPRRLPAASPLPARPWPSHSLPCSLGALPNTLVWAPQHAPLAHTDPAAAACARGKPLLRLSAAAFSCLELCAPAPAALPLPDSVCVRQLPFLWLHFSSWQARVRCCCTLYVWGHGMRGQSIDSRAGAGWDCGSALVAQHALSCSIVSAQVPTEPVLGYILQPTQLLHRALSPHTPGT